MSERIRRYLTRYVSPKWIFVIDLCTSMTVSLLVLLLADYATSMSTLFYQSPEFHLQWILSALVGTLCGMFVTRAYNRIIRHASLRDFFMVGVSAVIKFLIVSTANIIAFGSGHGIVTVLVADMAMTFVGWSFARMVAIMAFDSLRSRAAAPRPRQGVLVFGVSEKSVALISRLVDSDYKIVGFVTRTKVPSNLRLADLPVFRISTNESFVELAGDLGVGNLLFASETTAQSNKALINVCLAKGIKTMIVPHLEEVLSDKLFKSRIRDVSIEDLLGRDEIKISMDEIVSTFQGKVIMVTGAAGSIGSELCRQLATFGVRKLILFDNAETPMHNIRLELQERFPKLEFVPVIGDVRHINGLEIAFQTYRPQVVFHAAAYKHVPLMEENPCQAVIANVLGTRNVADLCLKYDVEKMVMISTDKAVNPTNIMGCTKRLAEIYVQSLGLAIERGEIPGKTKFLTTRFGNVLGSNGSVIPRFREQIEKGGPVTVTHPDITRFFMTIPEACRLVMEAVTLGRGNQIFVFDMGEPVKIVDLARKMITLAGLQLGRDIDIIYTGLRPGEKLYEEVLSDKENTEPTSHSMIRIAKVREYDYTTVASSYDTLISLASSRSISQMVPLMKQIVPEYISQNSTFHSYDKSPDNPS